VSGNAENLLSLRVLSQSCSDAQARLRKPSGSWLLARPTTRVSPFHLVAFFRFRVFGPGGPVWPKPMVFENLLTKVFSRHYKRNFFVCTRSWDFEYNIQNMVQNLQYHAKTHGMWCYRVPVNFWSFLVFPKMFKVGLKFQHLEIVLQKISRFQRLQLWRNNQP
jgi:hypothetical protein